MSKTPTEQKIAWLQLNEVSISAVLFTNRLHFFKTRMHSNSVTSNRSNCLPEPSLLQIITAFLCQCQHQNSC